MKKAERVTSVRNTLTEEQLILRLPELWDIRDEEIQRKTIDCFLAACPDDFWTLPSSSTGKYHPEDERGDFGNWLHTKRVYIQYRNLAEVHLKMGLISEYEFECGKSAALLHDMMKYGWPSDGNQHTVNDHDVIAAEVAEHMGDLPPEVSRTISTHMAKWGGGPEPESPLEWLLQHADNAVSPNWAGVGVYYPTKELQDLGVEGYNAAGQKL